MSKFRDIGAFASAEKAGYRLLPFNFTSLEDSRYVLTNMVGEHVVLIREKLEDLVRHRLCSSDASYQRLKGKHFLIDDDSDVAIDLLALKTRTRTRRLPNFTDLHIFVVSLRCEHSCPYCQVSRQSDDRKAFDMTPEIAERAIDLAFRSPAPSLKFEFQGGEPLLNFDLIKFIVQSVEKRKQSDCRSIHFVITTNLALVTDEILEFCKAHNILISTSLDGPADLHNSNRPRPGRNSHQKAVDGIQRARAVLGSDGVGALMTTTRASLARARDIVDEYLRLEFDTIVLRPLSPYGFAIKTKTYTAYGADEWLAFYFEALSYILQINKAGTRLVEGYAATILTKMLTPYPTGYVDLMSPAGIGIAAVVYNYDGYVYASDESRMLAEMGDFTFRIGNVLTDSFEQVFGSEALLDPLEASFAASVPMCSSCAFEPFCGSDPVFHYATQRDFVGRKPTSEFCQRNMAIFRFLISLMEKDEEAKRIFRQWVTA